MRRKTLLIIFILTIYLGYSFPQDKILFKSLNKGWVFKKDPNNIGLSQGWMAKDFKDFNWKKINPLKPWEVQGIKGDGIGWYRLNFKVPNFDKRLYLSFSGVDDEYTIFINGKKAGHFGGPKPNNSVWKSQTYLELSPYVKPGEICSIALRVVDWYHYGGIRGPVFLTTMELAAKKGFFGLIKTLSEQNKEWILPSWIRTGVIGWTMTGREAGMSEALMAEDGTIQPGNKTPTIAFAVKYNKEVFYPYPGESRLELLSGGALPICPIPICKWKTPENIQIESSHIILGANPAPDSETVGLSNITIKNNGMKTEELIIALFVRPFSVKGKLRPIYTIELKEEIVYINNKPFIKTINKPYEFYALEFIQKDISEVLLGKEIPKTKHLKSEIGLGQCALVFNVKLKPLEQKTISFLLPINPEEFNGVFPSKDSITHLVAETLDWWAEKVTRVRFELPEPELFKCFQASIGYILVSKDGPQLHPGPLAYDSFWYRDSAYMLAALNRAGLAKECRDTVDAMASYQLKDGMFPPIVNSQGNPVSFHEWDSQGQALFSFVDHYFFTKDKEWLESKADVIKKGVEFLIEKRKQRLGDQWKGKPEEGILPPSVSAEDLGSGSWHHYWDDFWAILGLKEAGYALAICSRKDYSMQAIKEAADLFSAVNRSIERLIKSKGITWIPNGPEDLEGTSMARGTSPAIWPGDLYPNSSILIYKSFDEYWKRWIEPYGGGYYHQGRIWPYGMELALCYVMLGERERAIKMLRWHINHQTLKGVYAWGEQVRTKEKTFLSGDMPHCWVAGDYINLLRGMLVFEKADGRLVLGAGVPKDWWEKGFSVIDAPTRWGKISYKVTPNKKGFTISVSKTPNTPNGIYIWFPSQFQNVKAYTSSGKSIGINLFRRPDTKELLYVELPIKHYKEILIGF